MPEKTKNRTLNIIQLQNYCCRTRCSTIVALVIILISSVQLSNTRTNVSNDTNNIYYNNLPSSSSSSSSLSTSVDFTIGESNHSTVSSINNSNNRYNINTRSRKITLFAMAYALCDSNCRHFSIPFYRRQKQYFYCSYSFSTVVCPLLRSHCHQQPQQKCIRNFQQLATHTGNWNYFSHCQHHRPDKRRRNKCSNIFGLLLKPLSSDTSIATTTNDNKSKSKRKHNSNTENITSAATFDITNTYFNDERYDIVTKNTNNTKYSNDYRPVDNYTMSTNQRLDYANHYPTLSSRQVSLSSSSFLSSLTMKKQKDNGKYLPSTSIISNGLVNSKNSNTTRIDHGITAATVFNRKSETIPPQKVNILPLLNVGDLNRMVRYLSSSSSSILHQNQKKQKKDNNIDTTMTQIPSAALTKEENIWCQERIRSFSSQIQLHGGYVLLDLHLDNDENYGRNKHEALEDCECDSANSTCDNIKSTCYSDTVTNLWKSVELFYNAYDYGYPLAKTMVRQITKTNTETKVTCKNHIESSQQQHEEEKNENSGGYNFLQISYNQHALSSTKCSNQEVQPLLNPPNLQAVMGFIGATNVLNALTALTSIGQSIAILMLTSFLSISTTSNIINTYENNGVLCQFGADSMKKAATGSKTGAAASLYPLTATEHGEQQKHHPENEPLKLLYTVASKLIYSLLHNEPNPTTTNGKYSGTYHRLARYVTMAKQTKNKYRNIKVLVNQSNGDNDDDNNSCMTKDNDEDVDKHNSKIANDNSALRSHTDWTVVTLIPVSAIAGLEIYDPSVQGWIRLEEIAYQHYLDTYNYNKNNTWTKNMVTPSSTGAQSDENNKQSHQQEQQQHQHQPRNPYWNSNYCIVMTGKLIEILSNGTIPSCIHRVVMNPNNIKNENIHKSNNCNNQRLSVPLFMRPKESVFKLLDQLQYEYRSSDNTFNNFTTRTLTTTANEREYAKNDLRRKSMYEQINTTCTAIIPDNDLYTLQLLRKTILQFLQ
jgi:hypothetical protein